MDIFSETCNDHSLGINIIPHFHVQGSSMITYSKPKNVLGYRMVKSLIIYEFFKVYLW